MAETVYPTFLLIGVAKAGTSWIYQVLKEHPEVFVPAAKDLKFFDEYFDKGMDWYLEHFERAAAFKARGELTHDYYFHETTAQRIHDLVPGVKLFCCLREIGDKLVSGYNYNRTTEFDRDLPFEEYAAMPRIVHQHRYAENLKPFYDRFGQERMLVLWFDDIADDPRGFCRELFAFLEVDPDFVPPSLQEKVNAAKEARVQFVAHAAFKAAHYLRKLGAANLVGNVKHHPITERFLYRPPASQPGIPEEVLRRIRRDALAQYDQLEALIGKPVPARWRALGR